MSISGISNTSMSSYVNRVASQKSDITRKTDSANSFQDVMKTARKEQQNTVMNNTVWEGDIVVSQPPDYSKFCVEQV